MADLDGIDTGGIQSARDCAHLIQRELMSHGMHSITQGNILNIE